jgi:protoporphyrinogen/coproporphyrinogen III oxidase
MKQVAIIGGGISGLSVLHYLKKRYQDSVKVTLFERDKHVGGTIESKGQDFLFEAGPNGFLCNPSTSTFVEELQFSHELIEANESSKRRYIQLNGRLLQLPRDPASFLQSPLLSSSEKLRLVGSLFKNNVSKDQSVYDHTSQRFGTAVAEKLVDPFLTGIYAGDIRRLHMASAFPKLSSPKQKTTLCSFKRGMGSLIGRLYDQYRASIQTDLEIDNLNALKADLIVVATPAYVAASLVGIEELSRIAYSPVAVVGLKIKKAAFKTLPDGFGYLIPSSEGKMVMGVLFESNVFPRQTPSDEMIVRVMIGGAHHPEILSMTESDLIATAHKELDLTYGLKGQHPSLAKVWPKAIPQYDLDYPQLIPAIQEEMGRKPHIRLCANYIGGISFNDCIKNARALVETLS